VRCASRVAQALNIADKGYRCGDVVDPATTDANDPGLLAAEFDSGRESLGRFAPAFSHICLVDTASAIFEVERQGISAG
jgi:hypothetical protein